MSVQSDWYDKIQNHNNIYVIAEIGINFNGDLEQAKKNNRRCR